MKFVQTPGFKLAIYAKGDENAKKVALVLPGRLDTKDYIHMTGHVDLLAGQGYYALSFDPPGSWESPGKIEDYTTTNYLKAVNELIEYLGNRPTLLVGHSRGGAIAMLAAAANKNVQAAVVIMSSFGGASGPESGEIKKGLYITRRDLPPGDSRGGPQKELSLPLSYFDDAKKYHPAESFKSFTGPKLVIYGTNDSFNSVEKVREVFETLPEPKTLVVLDTEHDYRYHADMIEAANQAILKFLKTGVK